MIAYLSDSVTLHLSSIKMIRGGALAVLPFFSIKKSIKGECSFFSIKKAHGFPQAT